MCKFVSRPFCTTVVEPVFAEPLGILDQGGDGFLLLPIAVWLSPLAQDGEKSRDFCPNLLASAMAQRVHLRAQAATICGPRPRLPTLPSTGCTLRWKGNRTLYRRSSPPTLREEEEQLRGESYLGVAILGRRSSGQEGEVVVGLFQYGKTSNDQNPRSGRWL
jgi:hypothetical protein